ncbi:hypothetical protein EOL94_04060 [bacterium]|nr:hypothetical protein [bacterium]
MPLFKGKGCKSYSGKVINYITDKNKAEIISSQNLNDNRSYSKQFQDTARLYNKGDKFNERKYYHFKLSCDQADNVTAKAHHEYAEEMAKKLFPNFECVIATHTDTKTVHSHIVVNAVSFENGKKLHCNNKEYKQMKDVANRIGAERGFSQLIYTAPSHDQVTRAEKEIILKGGTSWKEELREVITEAKYKSINMTEFEKHLNDYGVTLTRNTDKTIAYLHPQKNKAIRGEKLGLDYTKGEIVNVINKQQRGNTNTIGKNTRIKQADQNGVPKWVANGESNGMFGGIQDIEERAKRLSPKCESTTGTTGTTNKYADKQLENSKRIVKPKHQGRSR